MNNLKFREDEIGRKLREAELSGELRAAKGYGEALQTDTAWEQTPEALRMPFLVLAPVAFNASFMSWSSISIVVRILCAV